MKKEKCFSDIIQVDSHYFQINALQVERNLNLTFPINEPVQN